MDLKHPQYRTREVPLVLPLRYIYAPAHAPEIETDAPPTAASAEQATGDPLVIFLHGYTDNAASFLRRCFGATLPALPYRVLAPNGLFPVPVRSDAQFKEAYSHYFIAPNTEGQSQTELIPPRTAVDALLRVAETLLLPRTPVVVVGFSQGGLLAPLLAQALEQRGLARIARLVAVGTYFRLHAYPDPLGYPVDAIHGEDDEVIAIARSRESFATLKSRVGGDARGNTGEFFAVPGLGHSLNDRAREILRERLAQSFS